MVVDVLTIEGMPVGVEKIIRIRDFSPSEILYVSEQLEAWLDGGSHRVFRFCSDGDPSVSELSLYFSLADEDQGIQERGSPDSYSCGLTKDSMRSLVRAMRFVSSSPTSYVWGYDLPESVTRIDLLISNSGKW